ncbi:unnamed protein product [marine sediment metagenome]|uniref:PFL domain-containing protein n=1 Tax=marine sediment metagenome TaxID=412755 RepID=X1F3S6_9ZZZZ
MTIKIWDDEVIVGNRCSKLVGTPLYPEIRVDTLEQDCDSYDSCSVQPLFLSDEDRQILKEDIIPYLKHEEQTVQHRYYGYLNDDEKTLLEKLLFIVDAVTQPLFVSKWELRREGPMLFISLLIFLIFSLDGVITQFEALLMIISYFLYLILIIWSEKHLAKIKPEVRFADKERLDPTSFDAIESPHTPSTLFKDISFTLIGLLILLVTAEFTLLSAHDLAREFNIPENVIGILIVGFGTSLPELVADLTAIRRGSYGIAIGDILGSNICDILLATGSGAIIISFNVPMVILIFDLPVLFLALSITLYLLWTHKTLKKWEGALLIGFYGIYVIVKLLFFQI